jgi:Protein of unknown function (DUF3570)
MTRRILALFIVCLLLPTWPVFADKPRDGISYVFSFYGDNGKNLVIAPSVMLSKKLTDTYYLGANVGVDAITSATKKAPTTPAPAGEDDEDGGAFSYRVPASLFLTYDKGSDTLIGGGYYSYEDTYIGRSLFASYTRRLNLNNTALGIAYSQSFDYWVPDRPLPDDNRSERTLDLSFTQLLSPRQMVQFTYTSLRSEGFLAQPTDLLISDTFPAGRYAQYPDNRKGSAYAVRFITLLNEPTSFHALYRYYRDDWSIQSDTVNLELYRDLSPSVVLGARYRYYRQTAAYFAKPLEAYAPGDLYVAINYRMYAFHSNTVGMMAIIKPSKGFMSRFDTDKVKLKLSADIFSTSSHPNIQYQYETDRLTGLFTTIALDYDF